MKRVPVVRDEFHTIPLRINNFNSMKSISELEPTILTIFGGDGDLTWRKLIPALYNLFIDGFLPEKFKILSVDMKDVAQEEYNKRHFEGVNKFSRRGKADKEKWKEFEQYITYVQADITNDKSYNQLQKIFNETDKDWDTEASRIFYMAVSPHFIKEIAGHLTKPELPETAGNTGLWLKNLLDTIWKVPKI